MARLAWLNGQVDVAVHALRQCWELGRYSISFDVELIWQLVSILLETGSGRVSDDIQHWLKILEKQSQHSLPLQPAVALLRQVALQFKGQIPDDLLLGEISEQISAQLSSYTAITLLQLGDWLQMLGREQVAQKCWQVCADRHVLLQRTEKMLKAAAI